MIFLSLFANLLSPGVYTSELSAGYRVAEVASHSTIYMIGSAESGPMFEPTTIKTVEEFISVFGASPSLNAVKMVFANDSFARLLFARVSISPVAEVTIGSADEGDYTLTINGGGIVYPAAAGDDLATIKAGLISGVQLSNGSDSVEVVDTEEAGKFIIRLINPSGTLTVAATYTATGAGTAGDITAVVTEEPAQPSAQDYIYGINHSFDVEDQLAQGFLIAPEAFQLLADDGDRLVVGNAMEALAASQGFDWLALVEGHGDEITVNEIRNDAIRYVSPIGHTAYYAPYLINENGLEVPPSPAVAAIACKIIRARGYQYPAAGVKYKVNCKDVKTRYFTPDQDQLNPQNINLIRNLRNRGICVWGFRTRSADPLYRFTNTRVIMNVAIGSVRSAFHEYIGETADLTTLIDIEDTAASLLRRMWRSGALSGESEPEAFEIICDLENNPADERENGNVLLQIFVVPITAIEKILIQVFRTPTGQVQISAQRARVAGGTIEA